jgi:DnaK suppressor protein
MSADVAMSSLRTHRTNPAAGSPGARPDSSALDLAPHWRALLESRWRASLERVTELSLAYYNLEEVRARAAAGQLADRRVSDGRQRLADRWQAGARQAGARQARLLLRRAIAERRALAEIEAALARLTDGSFGRCERCGGAVSTARLTRTPQARYCPACDQGTR